jgi:hypothetical protein
MGFEIQHFEIHPFIATCLYLTQFLRLCYNTEAHLRHKWCVHSILPLAPRVKQPINLQQYVTDTTNQTLTTLGCGTRPVSVGSRRRRAE